MDGQNADIHRSDTMEEKLSLANRFGVTIGYYKPSRQEYHDIVSRTGGALWNIDAGGRTVLWRQTGWEMKPMEGCQEEPHSSLSLILLGNI